MIKRFLKDSFLYTLAALFTKGIGFLMLPIYTRVLSQQDYGTFDYLNAIGAFIAVLVALEITQGIMRFAAENQEDTSFTRRIVSTATWFSAGNYFIVILVCILFSEAIAELLLGDARKSDLIIIAVVNFSGAAMVYLINVTLRSQLRAKEAVVISAISAAFVACFSLVFIVVFDLGIYGLYVAQIMSALIVILIGYYRLRFQIGFVFDKAILKQMLSYSLPLVPSSLAIIVALNSDRLMIKAMLGVESVAIYGVAVRFSSIILLLMIGFQSALTPLIYSKYKEPSTPKDVGALFHWFMALSALFIVALFLLRLPLTVLIAGQQYKEASDLIPLLALSSIYSSMYLFFPGLSIAKKTGLIALINLFAAVFNVLLNFFFIKYIGVKGAAISTLISSGVSWLAVAGTAQKFYKIQVNYLFVTGYVGISLILLFSSI